MWPWGHLAFGYLCYSLFARVETGRPPGDRATLLLALGTQLPDLVDKTLAWTLHVTATGYSLGHSVFVAAPLGVAVVTAAARWDRPQWGIGFAVGWWSHLAGDVLMGLAYRYPTAFARVVWPLSDLPPTSAPSTAADRILAYLLAFVDLLLSTGRAWLIVAYVGALTAVWLLWLADGTPGLFRSAWS